HRLAMAALEHRPGRSKPLRPLLGAAALLVALLIGLTFVGGHGGFVACSPVAPAAEPPLAEPAALEPPPPIVLADPAIVGGGAAPSGATASPARAGPSDVAGIVIDAVTSEPVPELDVRLISGQIDEDVPT